jgi:multidrug efflux pump subunit AcrA (membrane-fusion protein)
MIMEKNIRPQATKTAVLLLAALTVGSSAYAQRVQDPPSVGVTMARVVRMAPKVALPGTVMSRNDSQLASEVEGRISWVAEVGTAVKAGDVVARIDNRLASLQLSSDKANLARLSAQLNFDRDQAARMENLFSQNAIA